MKDAFGRKRKRECKGKEKEKTHKGKTCFGIIV